MKVNPIAALFVGAINLHNLEMPIENLKEIEAIFDRSEKTLKEEPEKENDDGEEKKPE